MDGFRTARFAMPDCSRNPGQPGFRNDKRRGDGAATCDCPPALRGLDVYPGGGGVCAALQTACGACGLPGGPARSILRAMTDAMTAFDRRLLRLRRDRAAPGNAGPHCLLLEAADRPAERPLAFHRRFPPVPTASAPALA